MAQKGRSNHYRYPHRNLFRLNRQSDHFNEFPAPEKKQTPKTETTSPQNVGNNKWSRTDHIAFWGVLVQVALAVATFLLFMLTRDSNISANKSAEAATKSVTIAQKTFEADTDYNGRAYRNTIANQRKTDISDDIKQKKEDSIFNLQKKAVDGQIALLKSTQDRFEISNEPYLSWDIDTAKVRMKANGVIRFFYHVTPTSDRVVEGIRSCTNTVVWFGDSTQFLKEAFTSKEYIRLKKDMTYYHKGEKSPVYIDVKDPDNSIRRAFIDGKCVIFIVGRYEYINYINKKRRYYDCIIKAFLMNNQFSFMTEWNKNYDQEKSDTTKKQ